MEGSAYSDVNPDICPRGVGRQAHRDLRYASISGTGNLRYCQGDAVVRMMGRRIGGIFGEKMRAGKGIVQGIP